MLSRLSICTFIRSESLTQTLSEVLSSDRYILYSTSSESEFFDFIEQSKGHLDCLAFEDNSSLLNLLKCLYEKGVLLPVVVFTEDSADTKKRVASQEPPENSQKSDEFFIGAENSLFYAAELRLSTLQPSEIASFIDKAIVRYITINPGRVLPHTQETNDFINDPATRSFLIEQQRRLSEKLRERLGYLGVYYKRNPQFFLRNLSRQEKQKLLENLKSEYGQIVLQYFSQEGGLNKKIDEFVDHAFFSDISVSMIVEMHMELMEEFSNQLKLEGRSEEILLDYRLTLIDVIAHLGEMYRRSIPREL
ncbi:MAG: circadian clock protein KaiA [Coleofasciculaceae cyanobacterium]